MASIAAAQGDVESLIEDRPLVIAALNSPTQTVISGDAKDVDEVVARTLNPGESKRRD